MAEFQLSGNIGNGYVIIKGDSVAEVERMAAEYAAASDRIADSLLTVQQVALVKDAFSEKAGFSKGGGAPAAKPAYSGGGAAKAAGSFNRPASSGGGGAAGQVANGPDGNPTCPHGVKKLDYKKKDADQTRVHGWYCQSKDRAQQCKALTLAGHGDKG